MLCDSHAHFEADDSRGLEEVLARARAAGVTRLMAVGGSPGLNQGALEAAQRWPGSVQAVLGWDRHEAGHLRDAAAAASLWADLETQLSALRTGRARIAALGEMGLDFQRHEPDARRQEDLFRAGLAAARRLRLPVVVHSRLADAATLEALAEHVRELGEGRPAGVLHCFTGERDFAERLLDLGFLISFSGIVTFRNAEPLRQVARFIPDERLLVETDSPYLAPVPLRGRVNEPAFLPHVVACLAAVRGVEPEHIAEVTFRNAGALFGPA